MKYNAKIYIKGTVGAAIEIRGVEISDEHIEAGTWLKNTWISLIGTYSRIVIPTNEISFIELTVASET